MKVYKIESHIPPPANTKLAYWKELASRMKVGDSILFETHGIASSFRASAKRTFTEYRFREATYPDGTVRVWLIHDGTEHPRAGADPVPCRDCPLNRLVSK